MRARLSSVALTVAALSLRGAAAQASGFYLTDRGVRPLARGGAFVAGADDQSAAIYNPAGLTEAGNGVLVDAAFALFSADYTRSAQAPNSPAGTPPTAYPTVHGSGALLPLPTVIVSHNFNQRNWMFAFGVHAPYAALPSYPDSPTAPQRYSLYNLNGSALATLGVYAAYKPVPQFSFGLGVLALVGTFNTRVAFSACPAEIVCQPEDPDWDALVQLNAAPIFAPSATAGIRWQPAPMIVIGASGQLPFWVSTPATLNVRLPSAAFFDGSHVEGNRATVDFVLAPVVRAGVELRPTRTDRIEATFVFEGWGVHDHLRLTPTRDDAQPNGIRITRARGVGTYDLGPTSIARNFQHAYSIRLGYERDQALGPDWHLFPRLGVAYETSATAPADTSLLTFDTNKFLATVGLGLSRGRFRFDAMFAHAFTAAVDVDPRDARIYATAPFRTNDQAPRYGINGGHYNSAINVVGVGAKIDF